VNIDFSPSSKFAVCMEELYAHASASSSQENQAAQASDAAREEGVAVKTTNGKRRKRLPRAVAAKISYAERKAFSTKMANTILQASDTQGLFSCLVTRVSEEHLSLCRKTFESAKKKDDLADSLLQALSYARITYEV
jgi:membrane-bound ClpP family serine protease